MLYISYIPTEVDSNENHDAEDGDDDGSHDVHVHARDDHAEKNHSAFMLSHCDDAALEEEKHWFSVKSPTPPQLQFLSAVVPPRGMGQGWH